MKPIKYLLALAFLLSSFFAFAGEQPVYVPVDKHTGTSIEKMTLLDGAAFVQPQAGDNLVAENRSHTPVTAKWFVSYIDIKFTHFALSTDTASLHKQDVNRCHTVSLFLFPYHIFW